MDIVKEGREKLNGVSSEQWEVSPNKMLIKCEGESILKTMPIEFLERLGRKKGQAIHESIANIQLAAWSRNNMESLLNKIEQAQQEASTLAISLHKRHYSDVTQWELCDSAAGIISQINNMVAGLNEKIEQLEKENELNKTKLEAVTILHDGEVKEIKLMREVVTAAKEMRNCTGTGINSMPMLEAIFDDALSKLEDES